MKKNIPLSQSKLWERQYNYYQQRGIDAWEYDVPYYATSNPNIANSYANVIINFVREAREKATAAANKHPVYIVEFGTGSGTFSFYTLLRLDQLAKQLQLPEKSFVYVMSDMVEKNIHFWAKQPVFQDYIDKGMLDFAQFNMEQDEDIRLQQAGKPLSKLIKHPVVFIANYIFDTLRHDVFNMKDGTIEEGLVHPDPKIEETPPSNQSLPLQDMEGGLSFEPIDLPYYKEPELDGLLEYYRDHFPDRTMTLPIGGMRTIRNLRKLTNNQMLILATDKAYSQHFEQYQPAPPDLVFHGQCFSMTVNFHALGHYFKALDGDYYHQDTQQSIITSGFLAGIRFDDLPATAQALKDYLTLFSPSNLYTIYSMIEATRFSCTLDQIVAYLTMSHWDPHVFNSYLDAIIQKITSPYVTVPAIYDLCNGMKKVAENVYQNTKKVNTFANIGLLFQELYRYKDALFYYQAALDRGEPMDTTYYNMGLCHIMQQEADEALKYFRLAIDLNPDYILARGWISQIESKQKLLKETETKLEVEAN